METRLNLPDRLTKNYVTETRQLLETRLKFPSITSKALYSQSKMRSLVNKGR